MLRTLAALNWSLPYLTPDGVFGETTLEAVMTFQREAGLPVTGAADRDTWDAISAAYRRACQVLYPPKGTDLFPFPSERVEPGQSTPMLLPIQAMFCALAEFLAGVRDEAPCGTLDGATAENLRWLQKRGSLPVTGSLDRETYGLLSRVYETFVARSPRCAIRTPE
jgi:hypothetical protein